MDVIFSVLLVTRFRTHINGTMMYRGVSDHQEEILLRYQLVKMSCAFLTSKER